KARLTTFPETSRPRSAMVSKRDRRSGLFSRPPPPTRSSLKAKPARQKVPGRKDHAAHVSLPSDAIVKQQWIEDLDPVSPTRRLGGPRPRSSLELESPTQASLTRSRNVRKPSHPASQQGGALRKFPKPAAVKRSVKRAASSVTRI